MTTLSQHTVIFDLVTLILKFDLLFNKLTLVIRCCFLNLVASGQSPLSSDNFLLFETKIYFQIIIEAVRGSDGDSDISIDEILLFHGPCRMYNRLIFLFYVKIF